MIRIRYILFSVLVMTAMTVAAQEKSIVERTYWFDYDAASAQPLSQDADRIDISSLSPGIHTFSMRVKDNEGLWSFAVTKFFIISLIEDDIVAGKSITEQMYWFDYDAASAQPLSQGVNRIDISSLSTGPHTFTMRVKDSDGLWSSAVTQFFVILSPDVTTPEESVIERCLYWFDDNYSDMTVVDVGSATAMVPIDVSGLTAGEHTLYWRVGDSKGAWSDKVQSHLFRYTVPASGYGTFSAADNMAMGDGLKAYFATYLKETNKGLAIKVAETGSKVIPAETGVVLAGEASATYTMVPTTEEGTASDDNKLVAMVESRHVNAVDGEFTNFMLQGGKFVKILDEDDSVKMPAHRAYLPLPTEETANANAVTLVWDDDTTTGLDGVREKRNVDGAIYNLQGQKVENPSRGIYIINGKKVVVK